MPRIKKDKPVFYIGSNVNFAHASLAVKVRVATPVPTAVQMTAEDQVQQIELLTSTDDDYGGVIVEMDEPMDSTAFVSILRASISHWKQLVVSPIGCLF